MALEGLVYHQLGALRGPLLQWAEAFDLDARMVAAILVVERQQYHLPQALRAICRAGNTLLDLVGVWGKPAAEYVDSTRGWAGLESWLRCSRGFCRIKWETAEAAWARHKARGGVLVDERIICHHTLDAGMSIAVSCMILDELARQWEPTVSKIRYLVPIMATLYNVSNFANKPPHSLPRVGGSMLGVVADGVYISESSFGDRVETVYYSRAMSAFMEGRK